MRKSDLATEAFVTSNGVNRYSAFRIDKQAFYIATIFAAASLFSALPKTPSEMAVKAIGFQMAVEVARHFNTAVRWTFKMEIDLVSVRRLMAYALLPAEQLSGGNSVKNLKGKIEFTNVEMRYQLHLRPAIKDLTLKIESGMKVAVVGRTGAGKSSFFQLLQGFREPCQGKILIGGEDLSQLSKQSLRANLSVVLQSPYVNESETIRQNLSS